jgi:hypothetical protein
METKYLSYTQHVGYFYTVTAAQKFVDEQQKEKGVTFAIKVLPNSFGAEVYKTTSVASD